MLEVEIARQKVILNALEKELQALQTKSNDAPIPIEPIRIQVTDTGYLIDDEKATIETLLKVLESKTGKNTEWPILIVPNDSTKYNRIRETMEICTGGNFSEVAILSPKETNGG